jgi:hypothetical protein
MHAKHGGASSRRTEAFRADKVSRFFQDRRLYAFFELAERNAKPKAKRLILNDFEDWLGGRDSNPDNRVQSAVSYR